MRYYLRGPFTIAGAITSGAGVLLLALVSIALAIEGRPAWAWSLVFALFTPLIAGGLLLLRAGLKELTVDATGCSMRMPGGRSRRIDFENMRVAGAEEIWFARLNLVLMDARDGVGTRLFIPRNVAVFPQILSELKRRAPAVWAAAIPALPVVADRRLEYVALMLLGNLTMLPMLALLWWNTDVATESGEDLAAGAFVTLLIVSGLVGATWYMLGTLSYARFRRDGVLARSMLGVTLDAPGNRITKLEVRRQERSVKGMRFFEDDLFLTDAGDAEYQFPQRLIQTSRVAPRELADRLAEAWDLPVEATETRLFTPADPAKDGEDGQ
ncbi:MAG: hypothetical protein RIF32_01955 [Leptospirales bacterium]|jgi:hypothetical protein